MTRIIKGFAVDWGDRWRRTAMPRYFFNLTNGHSVADEVGEEFDGVATARGHATTVARELSRGRLPDALTRAPLPRHQVRIAKIAACTANRVAVRSFRAAQAIFQFSCGAQPHAYSPSTEPPARACFAEAAGRD